jgi:hypothetical protein
MKKPKTAPPFHFLDVSPQQVIDLLNEDYPISLHDNQELVERVYQRYPLISKKEVFTIIKIIFVSIRELLILGKILNFNGLFFDMKLLLFAHRKKGVIFPALKVHVSTPPPLRKL